MGVFNPKKNPTSPYHENPIIKNINFSFNLYNPSVLSNKFMADYIVYEMIRVDGSYLSLYRIKKYYI